MTETELLGEVQRAISFTDSDDGAMSVNQLSDELAIGPASVRAVYDGVLQKKVVATTCASPNRTHVPSQPPDLGNWYPARLTTCPAG